MLSIANLLYDPQFVLSLKVVSLVSFWCTLEIITCNFMIVVSTRSHVMLQTDLIWVLCKEWRELASIKWLFTSKNKSNIVMAYKFFKSRTNFSLSNKSTTRQIIGKNKKIKGSCYSRLSEANNNCSCCCCFVIVVLAMELAQRLLHGNLQWLLD